MFIEPSVDRGASRPRACDKVIPPARWRLTHHPIPVRVITSSDSTATPTRPKAAPARRGRSACACGGRRRCRPAGRSKLLTDARRRRWLPRPWLHHPSRPLIAAVAAPNTWRSVSDSPPPKRRSAPECCATVARRPARVRSRRSRLSVKPMLDSGQLAALRSRHKSSVTAWSSRAASPSTRRRTRRHHATVNPAESSFCGRSAAAATRTTPPRMPTDHAWPGWRDLPLVRRRPEVGAGAEHQKAITRWVEHVNAIYPSGWLESGGPNPNQPRQRRHAPRPQPHRLRRIRPVWPGRAPRRRAVVMFQLAIDHAVQTASSSC